MIYPHPIAKVTIVRTSDSLGQDNRIVNFKPTKLGLLSTDLLDILTHCILHCKTFYLFYSSLQDILVPGRGDVMSVCAGLQGKT